MAVCSGPCVTAPTAGVQGPGPLKPDTSTMALSRKHTAWHLHLHTHLKPKPPMGSPFSRVLVYPCASAVMGLGGKPGFSLQEQDSQTGKFSNRTGVFKICG